MTPKLQQWNPAFFCQIPAEAQMPHRDGVKNAVTWTLCDLEKDLWPVAQWVKIALSLQEFPLVEACLSYSRVGLNIWLHLTTAIPQGGDTQWPTCVP